MRADTSSRTRPASMNSPGPVPITALTELSTTHTGVLQPAHEGAPTDFASIEATLKEVTKVRGAVRPAALGSLPNDGKVIEDLRKYS